MPFKSTGSVGFDELRTYYRKSGATALSSFYKSNESYLMAPPITPYNSSVPSSGTISVSNLYGSYRVGYGAFSNRIFWGNSADLNWVGYQESAALISNGAIGTFGTGSDTYIDGNGNDRRMNGILYNKSTSTLYLKTATSSTLNNDLGLFRIYFSGGSYPFGVEFYTASAATTGMQGTPGSIQYGRYWTWSASNPFTDSTSYLSLEFVQ